MTDYTARSLYLYNIIQLYHVCLGVTVIFNVSRHMVYKILIELQQYIPLLQTSTHLHKDNSCKTIIDNMENRTTEVTGAFIIIVDKTTINLTLGKHVLCE